jgi:hypothetical protein
MTYYMMINPEPYDVERHFRNHLHIYNKKIKSEEIKSEEIKSEEIKSEEIKSEEIKSDEKTNKNKKSYYLLDEHWDIVLSFVGIQKISNFEQLQSIDLDTLMYSYININTHSKRNLIKLSRKKINKKNKYKSYYKNHALMQNYIRCNYHKLLQNNSLKQTLIYFHIKVYVTFLSKYRAYRSLTINLNIFNSADIFYMLCEKSKYCNKKYKIKKSTFFERVIGM